MTFGEQANCRAAGLWIGPFEGVHGPGLVLWDLNRLCFAINSLQGRFPAPPAARCTDLGSATVLDIITGEARVAKGHLVQTPYW
jgi:hypothetical protein